MATFSLELLAFLLGLAFLIFKLFGISIFKGRLPSGLPDGSMGYLPVIGETLGLLKAHNSTTLGDFFQQRCSRYGRVFRSHLFGRPTVVSCDHELNIFIFRNEETLFKACYPQAVRNILGKSSVIHVTGDLHKQLRSAAVGLINDSLRRHDFIQYANKLSASFVHSLKGNEKVLLLTRVKELTFFMTVKNFLNMEADDPLARKLHEAFVNLTKALGSVPLNIPGTDYSKALKTKPTFFSTLREIIRKKENMKSQGDSLDQLLANGFSEDLNLDFLLDLLIGGYETTSHLMSLAVYFLAKDPSSLRTLRDEHQLVRESKKEGETLNWEDYKNMKFTSHVINEALRCGNVAPFMFREAVTDVQFKEYTIPSGWQVLTVVSGVHLDPSLHEQPSEFNPQRWDDTITNKNVTPFGGGLRICPGSQLAKFLAALFLHHFVLNLRWKVREDECPVLRPTLHFKRGLELEIEQIE